MLNHGDSARKRQGAPGNRQVAREHLADVFDGHSGWRPHCYHRISQSAGRAGPAAHRSQVGYRAQKKLEEMGQLDNTIVAFTTDTSSTP
ncbi:MAG: hypothetical protein WCE38_15990 [Burkholderiales bacterium]